MCVHCAVESHLVLDAGYRGSLEEGAVVRFLDKLEALAHGRKQEAKDTRVRG